MPMAVKGNSFFGDKISPACVYCELGHTASDKKMILCKKKGVVSPYYSCKKFVYAPLKRIPKRLPKLPSFSDEDFSL